MIRHTSFAHGWYYHYRHHVPKTDTLCKDCFSGLKSFIDDMHDNCPQEPFLSGPRSSKLRTSAPVDMQHVKGHEVSSLAKLGHELIEGKTAHTRVQLTMLERDNKTIAVEVPLWLEASELEYYSSLFGTEEPLSGHIDVLRIEEGRIWVWDYKPKAAKEKYASTQVLFYALMLSVRTGISLDHIYCGYFDEEDTYIFKPEHAHVEQLMEVMSHAH